MAQALVTAQDYRGFLAEAFRLQKLTHPNFSLASFARKAEFASRSYARDVIQGQKRITASSLPKFIKGLGLRGALKDAFIYLVGLSEPDAVMDLPPRVRTQRALDRLKEHMQGHGSPLVEKLPDDIFQDFQWTLIFAALGDQSGTTVKEIVKKTGIEEDHVRRVLRELVNRGVATPHAKDDTFAPGDPSLVFTELGHSDFFKRYYLHSLQLIRHLATRNFADQQALFFNATVSVAQDDLPRIRDDLRSLALQFLERQENPRGTALCQLNIGWVRHHRMQQGNSSADDDS